MYLCMCIAQATERIKGEEGLSSSAYNKNATSLFFHLTYALRIFSITMLQNLTKIEFCELFLFFLYNK